MARVNLGEFVKECSIWSLLPLLFFLVAGLLWIARILQITETIRWGSGMSKDPCNNQ
jgi:hypothetical protein